MTRDRLLTLALCPRAVLLMLSCETVRPHQTFWVDGAGMKEAFQRYADTAPPEAQRTLEMLKRDPRVRIHILRGPVDAQDSRGAASAPHRIAAAANACLLHPAADGDVEPDFDWDILYSESKQKQSAAESGFESPVETLLQHELMGHFMSCYQTRDCDPGNWSRRLNWARDENEANARENDYRRHRKLPEVNWKHAPRPADVTFQRPKTERRP